MSSAQMNTQNINAAPQAAAAPGLYIPVHRRAASRGDAASATGTNPSSPTTSTRSLSPTEEYESKSGSPLLQLPIYTMQELLMLSKSPLATFSQENREKLREAVPEILMNRKQRKSRAAREHQHNHQQHQRTSESETHQVSEVREPLSPMWTPQNPARRVRTKRRNTKKFVDELSWRVPRTRTISANGTVLPLPVAA